MTEHFEIFTSLKNILTQTHGTRVTFNTAGNSCYLTQRESMYILLRYAEMTLIVCYLFTS